MPPLDWFRDLYRRVGEEWLWISRIRMPDAELAAIIQSPLMEIYALAHEGRDEGLLELDFREPGQCEFVSFGVTEKLVGTGAGRWLMNRALEIAWSRPVARVWLHTCTFDHPAALAFYQRSGFRPFRRQVEVDVDYRVAHVAADGIRCPRSGSVRRRQCCRLIPPCSDAGIVRVVKTSPASPAPARTRGGPR